MSTSNSEYYQPGGVIYHGVPFVTVLEHDMWSKVCANCNESAAFLKKCGACGIMKYCGKTCQGKAWPNHKLECPYLKNLTNGGEQTLIQLVGNTILKIKGRDWKTITDCLMDKEVSFDDLISHVGTKKDPQLIREMHSVKSGVESYIGLENLPNEKELFEIIGKVFYNSFAYSPSYCVSNSRALFIGVSKLDHSCVPNATLVFNGKQLVVRAIKVIHKTTEKVTILYNAMVTMLDSSQMIKNMKNSFLEGCYCDDCSQPFGTSPLTKIIDGSKANRVMRETEATLKLMSLLALLKYPIDIVDHARLTQLLQKQEGVLGRTNLLRMRTLAMKSLFKDGPIKEMKNELTELANTMKEVWGDNFEELLFVYKKLMAINMKLNDFTEVAFYSKKISQVCSVCYGDSRKMEKEGFEVFMKTFNHLRCLMKC